jgi:hypothetical protein
MINVKVEIISNYLNQREYECKRKEGERERFKETISYYLKQREIHLP